MSASRQYAASSGVCDAHGHLAGRDTAREGQEGHGDAPFNILCHAAAGLRYMQNVAYGCDGATFQEDAMGSCSLNDEISEAVATRGAEAPQVGTGNALGKLGSVGLNKRRREQTSNLSAVDTNESSDDGARGSKRSKVDCDCEDDHLWWMTIKIGDMNEALHRIDAAIGLVVGLAYGSNDLDSVTINNLVDLLKNSRAILDSAKDDMRAEGGIDREATE
ncbi:hypothetical protein BKA61DRAFT_680419 [Leptodontidium sp. MPI-SDFR-AT-0119]|nr:hypothetical protein BKA61DRAFT_680419 [Leptodontidium sp. MPI-SDFR-AT-0119]